MSKKNKAKFKRQIKNQVLQQMAQVNSTSTLNQENIPPAATVKPVILTNNTTALEVQNLPQIKNDLIKTAIVMVTLILIIVVLAVTDQKYHELLTFGSWLFRVLHIQ
jgi:hypothetical protein